MTDLPRSQSLVVLDGPGHILPIEPVTPPNSSVWKVIHFPVMLVIVALGLLALAEFGTTLFATQAAQFGAFRGARLIAPALSMVVVIAVYAVFVRLVERRREITEFGARGWIRELGLGFGGGLLLAGLIFGVVALLGGIQILGFNPASMLLVPLVSAVSAGFIQEIILRGLFFRLIERFVGSWAALAVSAAMFWAGHLLTPAAPASAGLAIVLEAGLILAALYMVTRRLWAAVGLHAAGNFAQAALYGVVMPGSVTEGFVRTRIDGPDWLTGGAYGVDSSVPALLVNAALFGALLVVAVRRGRIVRPLWRQRRAG